MAIIQQAIDVRKAWLRRQPDNYAVDDPASLRYVIVDVISWGSGDDFTWDIVIKNRRGDVVAWLQLADPAFESGYRFADGPSWDSRLPVNPETIRYGLPERLEPGNRFAVVRFDLNTKLLVEVDRNGNPVSWFNAMNQQSQLPLGDDHAVFVTYEIHIGERPVPFSVTTEIGSSSVLPYFEEIGVISLEANTDNPDFQNQTSRLITTLLWALSEGFNQNPRITYEAFLAGDGQDLIVYLPTQDFHLSQLTGVRWTYISPDDLRFQGAEFGQQNYTFENGVLTIFMTVQKAPLYSYLVGEIPQSIAPHWVGARLVNFPARMIALNPFLDSDATTQMLFDAGWLGHGDMYWSFSHALLRAVLTQP